MFQKKYREMNEKILPDVELRQRVLEKIGSRQRVLAKIAVAAAVIALVVAGVPVMAARVPPISELMYQVSPEMAARFTLVQESCTVDGIRMEVVSASVHGATAEVCISFEDLQGDRIGDDLREDGAELLGKGLFKSGSWGGGTGNFDYDVETGKAIMVIDRNYSFYSAVKGRYLTVDELFSGKITVSVDRLYRLVRGADGNWVEQTLAEGPWRVSFAINESDYVGERDDGVPQVTQPE